MKPKNRIGHLPFVDVDAVDVDAVVVFFSVPTTCFSVIPAGVAGTYPTYAGCWCVGFFVFLP